MRVLILALSVLGILLSADAAKAGLSTTTRDLWASVDPATFTDEATQETEKRNIVVPYEMMQVGIIRIRNESHGMLYRTSSGKLS